MNKPAENVFDAIMAVLTLLAIGLALWMHKPLADIIWRANCLLWVWVAHKRGTP